MLTLRRTRSRGRPWVLATLALGPALACPVSGQVIVGLVVDEESRGGLPGVAVVAVDSVGRRLVLRLTDESGRYSLPLPFAGTFVLQADRIGYRSEMSERIRVGAVDTISHVLVVASEAVTLAELAVVARPRCELPVRASPATAVVWDEVRKALELTTFAQSEGFYRFTVRRFERQYGLDRETVLSDRRWGDSTNVPRAFKSADIVNLLSLGFVQEIGEETTYYGPDADVILSDIFLESHCFYLVEGDDEDRLGLAFRPVESRGVPEVEGVLWLDRASAELARLEYRYVGLDVPGAETARGEVEYDEIGAGEWIVRRWSIRAPILWLKPNGELAFDGVKEVGGRVVGVERRGIRRESVP